MEHVFKRAASPNESFSLEDTPLDNGNLVVTYYERDTDEFRTIEYSQDFVNEMFETGAWVLVESQKDFDQFTFYGEEVTWQQHLIQIMSEMTDFAIDL